MKKLEDKLNKAFSKFAKIKSLYSEKKMLAFEKVMEIKLEILERGFVENYDDKKKRYYLTV